MPIPEDQLVTWSHQGSVTQSSNTYNAIKRVLEAKEAPYASQKYEAFLQGSYGNDTNVYADSDVDIVMCLTGCWQSDLSKLSSDDKAAYDSAFVTAKYGHADFKRDVVKVLRDAYGSDVSPGGKAIAIMANETRRKSDVIAAVGYRRYYRFKALDDQRYDEGICFFTAGGERIANYPKQHSVNLTRKHQATNNRFKKTVRVLKNMRNKLVKEGTITAALAPSYYLEGLLYNVPDSMFSESLQDSMTHSLDWIQNNADKEKMVCANEQYYLLREGQHTCWSPASAELFLTSVVRLWNDW